MCRVELYLEKRPGVELILCSVTKYGITFLVLRFIRIKFGLNSVSHQKFYMDMYIYILPQGTLYTFQMNHFLILPTNVSPMRKYLYLGTWIETGRWSRLPKEKRLCSCGMIPTEEHVLPTHKATNNDSWKRFAGGGGTPGHTMPMPVKGEACMELAAGAATAWDYGVSAGAYFAHRNHTELKCQHWLERPWQRNVEILMHEGRGSKKPVMLEESKWVFSLLMWSILFWVPT